METIERLGILTSISWNSNDWSDDPTEADLRNSNYDYVIENSHAHEALNFGHEIYPAEENDTYIAYTPIFNRLPSASQSKDVLIVFFISTDYRNNNAKKIVGCYGYPGIAQFYREAKHKKFNKYDFGNVLSPVEYIVYFKNHVTIDNDFAQSANLLPKGKKISQQGFNYLTEDNVFNILAIAQSHNKGDKKLKKLIRHLREDAGYTKEEQIIEQTRGVIQDRTADSLADISALEKRAQKSKPDVKVRVSKYIERGAIANKVKQLTDYKCLVCEQLGMKPLGFKKKNGQHYVESHHVQPVSQLKKGSLSVANLITVCANHHRMLHYGDCEVLKNTEKKFVFRIEKKKIEIEKITIPNSYSLTPNH